LFVQQQLLASWKGKIVKKLVFLCGMLGVVYTNVVCMEILREARRSYEVTPQTKRDHEEVERLINKDRPGYEQMRERLFPIEKKDLLLIAIEIGTAKYGLGFSPRALVN
jgi:hypothetical protein